MQATQSTRQSLMVNDRAAISGPTMKVNARIYSTKIQATYNTKN